MFAEIIPSASDLDISLPHPNPISISPGETFNLPVNIDVDSAPPGVYDDILLKLVIEDGKTLYANLKVTVTEPGAPDLPDLALRADDIRLADYTLGESATLEARITNKGTAAASAVAVQFYEFGNLLGETVIDAIAPGERGTATVTAPFTAAGEHLVRVVVDGLDAIAEQDETNNEAGRLVKLGAAPPIPGCILVTGSLPSTVYTNHLFTISGRAAYDIYVGGVRYTEYVVKGGTVQLTVRDEDGNEWLYGDVHTDIDGRFARQVQAPGSPGTCSVIMTVSDGTFSGRRNLLFSVVDPPPVEPAPPRPPASSGQGSWTYTPGGSGGGSPGTWNWTWTTPPQGEPAPVTDLRVFSENIHFSNTNPAVEEEITVFAEILYWATSTDLTAENVPVNFYVTYPDTPRMKIGETIIHSMSVGAPDHGSRYVFANWANRNEGIYIVEVEIDPEYLEENQLNNAATRGIIVGQLQSLHGAISGQVTDPWGGVGGVMLELHDGDTFLENTMTDDTGYYVFKDVPVDDYRVRILRPDGYTTDDEEKDAAVTDQAMTVVDFRLDKLLAPTADAGGPYAGEAGSPITLDGSGSADPDGIIISYHWDLDGDGVFDLATEAPTVTHTWESAFSGTVRLQVQDDDGLTATDEAQVLIDMAAPCCDLDGDGDCDNDDYNLFLGAYGKVTGDEGFIAGADYDEDGIISLTDYQVWYRCYWDTVGN